jgi:uncharacterized protein
VTAYNDQNIPTALLNAMESPLDHVLGVFAKLFVEWKFMTIFSILFGYGFGLILAGLEKKNINPTPFFIRRMSWLFVIGILHAMFWWGDVLHFYAVTGLLLLACRKLRTSHLLIASCLCMFLIPPLISFFFINQPSFFTEENLMILYRQYKYGGLGDIIPFNLRLNYEAYIITGRDLNDIILTLGRFLFGYYLLRIGLFDRIEHKKAVFTKLVRISAPITIAYIVFRWWSLQPEFGMNEYLLEPLLGVGLFTMACCYMFTLVWLNIHFGTNKLFRVLQSLGKMTLSNYLLVSVCSISFFYGIGFGLLGELPMRSVWLFACCCLCGVSAFSIYWLDNFRYGPAEWIWRQLTYKKRIPLSK